MKDRSENRPRGTPAQSLGIVKRALEVDQILRARLFQSREPTVRGWLAECYFGRIMTRAIENCVVHSARYAM